MDGSLSIYPEQLGSVSGRFTEVGDDLAEAVKAGAARLDEAGEPWGRDDEGEQFARAYQPAATAAMHALVEVAQCIPRIGVGLRHMAASASSNEADIAVGLRDSGRSAGLGAGSGFGGVDGSMSAGPGPGAIARALNPALYDETITTQASLGGHR